MKKTLPVLLALIAVTISLSSSAWAIFSPQTRFTQMTFQTSTYVLKISLQANPTEASSFQNYIDSNTSFVLTKPGVTDQFPIKFWLYNGGSTPSIPLTLKAKLENGSADWSLLKDAIEINFKVLQSGQESEWYSLSQVMSSAVPLPGGTLIASDKRQFQITTRLRSTYAADPDGTGPLQAGSEIGNELAGKTTGTMQLVFIGETL